VEDDPKIEGELKWMDADNFSVLDFPSYQRVTALCKGDSIEKRSKIATKSEHLPSSNAGKYCGRASLPTGMRTMKRSSKTSKIDSSASFQSFMSENEMDKLVNRHEHHR